MRELKLPQARLRLDQLRDIFLLRGEFRATCAGGSSRAKFQIDYRGLKLLPAAQLTLKRSSGSPLWGMLARVAMQTL